MCVTEMQRHLAIRNHYTRPRGEFSVMQWLDSAEQSVFGMCIIYVE